MSRAFDSNQRLILLRPALVVTPSIQGDVRIQQFGRLLARWRTYSPKVRKFQRSWIDYSSVSLVCMSFLWLAFFFFFNLFSIDFQGGEDIFIE